MDALDKLAFSFPTMVRALLRLLPKALTAELDPRTLRRLPTTHVGPGLRQRHADMPWRIACRPAAGRPPWPHVLLTLEFQATVDRHMVLRVETYTALLRQDLLREGRFAGPNRELPRILPVVVYTGRERWNAPLGVRALTAPGPEALASLQPDAACVLLDGPALPDDDVRRNLAAALITVQSCAEASRMPERVAGLLGLLRRTGDAALGKALRDGLRRMLETRFGGELPRRWMEEPMTLEHRMDEWEQEWFRQGRRGRYPVWSGGRPCRRTGLAAAVDGTAVRRGHGRGSGQAARRGGRCGPSRRGRRDDRRLPDRRRAARPRRERVSGDSASRRHDAGQRTHGGPSFLVGGPAAASCPPASGRPLLPPWDSTIVVSGSSRGGS